MKLICDTWFSNPTYNEAEDGDGRDREYTGEDLEVVLQKMAQPDSPSTSGVGADRLRSLSMGGAGSVVAASPAEEASQYE